jgi:hypothetical protein
MAVTPIHVEGREQFFQQIDRLVNSHSLHGSESLCKLLRYLAEQTLAHPGASAKEYQIATEVFGRPATFDPHMDSTVRVQAGRLRVKLAEYYGSEGKDDAILVELPKGSYVLAFRDRTPALPPPAVSPITVANNTDKSPHSYRTWAIAVLALSILLVAALAVITNLLSPRHKSETAPKDAVPAAYQVFWSRFVTGPSEPWVIFSNGAFVGRPETGMRYFNAITDSRSVILDHYTGVGEVLAVHALDSVFVQLNRQIRVKRGTLFSLDDAKNNDLIFVGSPAENLTLLEIPGTKQFVFQRVESGPRKGDLGVVNVHPQPGEPKVFLASPANEPTTVDYAVIGLVPGMDPPRSVLILAGTTTMGTQAAAEYVCRQDSLEDLLRRLGVSRASELKSFEAVLKVKVTHGVPLNAELVALRKGS